MTLQTRYKIIHVLHRKLQQCLLHISMTVWQIWRIVPRREVCHDISRFRSCSVIVKDSWLGKERYRKSFCEKILLLFLRNNNFHHKYHKPRQWNIVFDVNPAQLLSYFKNQFLCITFIITSTYFIPTKSCVLLCKR
jgi:hypothetical protein